MFKQKTVFLIGDFNINFTLSSNTSVNLASDYINLLASYGYFPLITIPTRVTSNSSTLIDHILTNDSLHAIKSGVIRTDLTDHYPIFCSISDKIIRKESQFIYKRNLSNFKTDDFSLDLYSGLSAFFNVNNNINKDNFNAIFSNCIKIISKPINRHAPIKKLSRKKTSSSSFSLSLQSGIAIAYYLPPNHPFFNIRLLRTNLPHILLHHI